jgi:hypothetical protein
MRDFRIAAVIVVLAIVPGLAMADASSTPPTQKPGLWDSSMTYLGVTTPQAQTCLGGKQKPLFSSNLPKNCSVGSVTHNADGSWDGAMTCNFESGSPVTTRSHISGDWNSKINQVVTSDESKMPSITFTHRRVGDCKPGMKSGEVILSRAMTNLFDGKRSGAPSH